MERSEIPILLVEDSPRDVSIIQRYFEKAEINNPLTVLCDGAEAITFLRDRSISFGVLILDIHLPKASGMDVLHAAKQVDSEVVAIMLTGQASVTTAVQSLRREGAFDYLEKSKDDLSLLVETVQMALEKREITMKSQWEFKGVSQSRWIDMTQIAEQFGLSNRELDVVKCLCQGGTNREIAEKLFISELTVKVHLKKVYEKMKIHNRTALSAMILSNTIHR